MIRNFKHIHLGKLITQRMVEADIDIERAANFLSVSEDEIRVMCKKESLDTEDLLRWSKILKYDFFRIYSQHLILYAPPKSEINKHGDAPKSTLPEFKKNIYAPELIQYLIGLIESGQKTAKQIQEDYNIPSSTILRWIYKYKKSNEK